MSEEQKKTYNNAPLADKEYYAKPRWHEVAVNEKSGNLTLTVLWEPCDAEGHPGCYDMETGAETPLPEGADGWEAVSNTYVIAFAEEAANLSKCRGKDIEFIKDVCPKTYAAMKRILGWCPNWDVKRVMWFTDCRESFYANVVRLTVVHEEWNGQLRAKAKFTNSKERHAKEVDTTEVRGKIASTFGGFFDVTESAPAPKAAPVPSAAPSTPPSTPSKPAPAPAQPCTKADCWATYCRIFNAKDTTAWFDFIRAFGKKESEFTYQDWGNLNKRIEDTPPF